MVYLLFYLRFLTKNLFFDGSKNTPFSNEWKYQNSTESLFRMTERLIFPSITFLNNFYFFFYNSIRELTIMNNIP